MARTRSTRIPIEKMPGMTVLMISFAVIFVVLTILGFVLAARLMV